MHAIEVDVERVEAVLTFDLGAGEAHARAAATFRVPSRPGHPALDLRQSIESLSLDGVALSPDDFPHVDLGGGAGAAMRVLDATVEPGERHELQLAYPLGVPDVADPRPIEFEAGRVRFDLWMSDLHPGRYLEQWLPAGLCGDRLELTVRVELDGSAIAHRILTNGTVTPGRPGQWTVEFPDTYTSLSPMLVVVPSDEIEVRTRELSRPALILETAKLVAADVDLAGAEADIAGWLAANEGSYGPYCHGSRFVAFVWASSRGMEYDGATTASAGALEHEVFHSWFGRGVKPARASDGWIDEAWTTWCTSSRRYEGGRLAVEPLGLDEEPVLLHPPNAWSRHTPVESYDHGARLFAGLADLLGGSGALRATMSEWYRRHAGGFVDTAGLEAQLSRAAGKDLRPWFDRYVHGRG